MARKALIVFIFSFTGSFYIQSTVVSAASRDNNYISVNNTGHEPSVDLQKQQVSKDIKQRFLEVVSNKRFLDSQPFCFASVHSFINTLKAYELHARNTASYFSAVQLFEPGRAPPFIP